MTSLQVFSPFRFILYIYNRLGRVYAYFDILGLEKTHPNFRLNKDYTPFEYVSRESRVFFCVRVCVCVGIYFINLKFNKTVYYSILVRDVPLNFFYSKKIYRDRNIGTKNVRTISIALVKLL